MASINKIEYTPKSMQIFLNCFTSSAFVKSSISLVHVHLNSFKDISIPRISKVFTPGNMHKYKMYTTICIQLYDISMCTHLSHKHFFF